MHEDWHHEDCLGKECPLDKKFHLVLSGKELVIITIGLEKISSIHDEEFISLRSDLIKKLDLILGI